MSKRNQEIEKFIREILEMYNCDTLYIVDDSYWYGNRGEEVCYIDIYNKLQFLSGETPRSVYKVAHRIWNDTRVHRNNRIFVSTAYDGSLVLFNSPHINRYNSDLYILHNGQLFDAFRKHWYDIHTSKTLRKWLKKGYIYTGPEDFYKDQCEDSNDVCYDSSDEGCIE